MKCYIGEGRDVLYIFLVHNSHIFNILTFCYLLQVVPKFCDIVIFSLVSMFS